MCVTILFFLRGPPRFSLRMIYICENDVDYGEGLNEIKERLNGLKWNIFIPVKYWHLKFVYIFFVHFDSKPLNASKNPEISRKLRKQNN